MIKRKATRALAALAIGSAAALVVTACSSNPTTEPDEDQPLSGSIAFSNWQWLAPGSGDALWDAVSSAYEDQGEVVLERSETPFAQYANKLNTELGAGGGPDVFVVGDVQFTTLAEAGLLEPLGDVVGDVSLNGSNDSLVVDEEQVGVTWEQVGYALVGNKNVMAEAGITEMPANVDELIEAGKKVEATGASGFGVRHQMSDFGGWYVDFPAWTYGYGGSFSDGTELTIDSPENIEGLTQYKRVIDSGIVPIGDDASTFRSKFKENQLGFVLDNSGAVLSFTTAMSGQDIVAAPLPFPEGGQNQHLILAVNANSENKAAALDFVSWVLSDEGQTILREQRGASTLATDVPLDPAFAEANPWAETYIETADETRSGLIVGFEENTEPIMRIVMQAVERVITQGEDPAEALGQAQEEAEQQFAE
jgi:multiple sugar transport system substrate-binding protein